MIDTLKERLDALSEKATPGPWITDKTFSNTYIGPMKANIRSLSYVVAFFETHPGITDGKRGQNEANANFIRKVVNAFRSGDLVTKEELEAAVAKAVAKEREACAEVCMSEAREFQDGTEIDECSRIALHDAASTIRARGEGVS